MIPFLLGLLLSLTPHQLKAAPPNVTFVGADITTNDAWRTTNTVKPLDVDGDNIYGTDGFYLYSGGTHTHTSPPAYATVTQRPGTTVYAGNASYIFFDNPDLTGPGPVANVITGVVYDGSNPTEWVEITFTQAGVYRVGIITDNADFVPISPLNFRFQQFVGGSVDTGYIAASTDRDRDIDYYLFDVEANSGDVYRLSGQNDPGHGSNGIAGLFFDSLDLTLIVDRSDDTNAPAAQVCDDALPNDCSLRGAISKANADTANVYTILFDSSLDGTPIILTINGSDNSNTQGDLDITDDLIINGNGAGSTIVDGSGLTTPDRVFNIPVAATVELNDLTVRGGSTATTSGGGIYNQAGTVTINDSTISSNSAGDDGGGVATDGGGTTTINNSTISDNSTVDDGGGVSNNGATSTTNINNSTISGNMLTGDMLLNNDGGGIRNNNGSMTINASLINNNSALDDGGGIVNTGTLIINNSTISNNSATALGMGQGGGIYNPGTVTVNNSTLSGNSAVVSGGAIENTVGTVNMQNSIVTNSTGGGYCSGTINSTNNLVNDATCGIAANAVTNFDTNLADNGGPTRTHALLAGSNAIDMGTGGCSGLATDQRGLPRPVDGDGDSIAVCDIGAFEAGEMVCGIQAAAPNSYTFGSITIDINNAGTNLDCLQVTHISEDHPNATGGIQTGQYWVIEGLQSDGSTAATEDYNADLTLPHSITPDTNAFVCRWTGAWDCARSSSTPTTVNRLAVPGFSDWAVGDNVTPTAISLKSLSATSATAPAAALLFVLWAGLVSWRLVRRRREL